MVLCQPIQCVVVVGRGGDQLSTFDPDSKSAKNQICLCLVGEVGGGGEGGIGDQLPTFDPEFKFPKKQISVCLMGFGRLLTNFQLLVLSPNLLKNPIFPMLKVLLKIF